MTLYKIEVHPSAARGVAVRDFVIVPTEAPADKGVGDTPLAPYFFKHLTCDVCCGKLVHMNGMLICESCNWTEGCCD